MTYPNQEQHQDEFYIGYGQVPPKLGNFLKIFIPVLVIGYLLLACILPLIHNQFNSGKLGAGQEFEGLLIDQPVPQLLVPRQGDTASEAAYSRYLLTGPGKTAPAPEVMAQSGEWVKLMGLPVYRDNLTVIATQSAETIAKPQEAATLDQGKSLGEFSLIGEIVDSKCYPGVMKPGQMKTHRSCAIRCISGGVPPVFVTHNQQGEKLYLLLADSQGKAVNAKVLGKVADPISITGEVVKYGDMFILKAEPKTYKLLL